MMQHTAEQPDQEKEGPLMPYLKGHKVHLRGLERSDLTSEYLNWLNNGEVNRYLYVGRRPSTFESLDAFYEEVRQSPNCVMFAVVEASSGKFVGTVKMEMFDAVSRVTDLGLMIGDKKIWGKGYATEACRLAVRWSFERWNAHKVSLGLLAGNAAAARAYEKAGFVREATLKAHQYQSGKYHDVIIMGLLRGEWERQEARRGE